MLWGGICFFALLRKSRCKHSFRLTAVCAVVVLLGIGVGAYNPYLTNWKEHGSPVYPLSGNGKVDIMDCQVLPAIRGKSNAETALISVASNPSDDMLSEDIHVFGISKIDILSSVASDVRIGGFGIFFFEAILLSIVLFVCTGHIRLIGYSSVGVVGSICRLFLSIPVRYAVLCRTVRVENPFLPWIAYTDSFIAFCRHFYLFVWLSGQEYRV